MVTITIARTGKLEKPMGLGEGRIVEGRIVDSDWGATKTIDAGSLGLKSITSIHLTMGSIFHLAGVGTPPMARIKVAAGSYGSYGCKVNILAETGSYPLYYIAVGF